jgi:hypothetical protein
MEMPAFANSHFARAPRFPAVELPAQADYLNYLNTQADMLERRALYEQGMGSVEAEITQAGTCAPCLRPARFTSATAGCKLAGNGKRVPHWPQAMRCDCEAGLTGRQRAMLHFVQANGLLAWSRVKLFGPPDAIDARIAALAGMASHGAGGGFHLAVGALQSPLQAGEELTTLAEALVPGGRLLFMAAFDPAAMHTSHRQFGWDLLATMREAGFRGATAYLYWSEELGYLGGENWVFRGIK